MNVVSADPRGEARAALTAGDGARALAVMRAAVGARPGDAALLNSAGDVAMKAGDPAQAACWFDAAAEAEPGRVEYALNQAIALSASGEKSAALALLRQIERQAKHEPRYCSARAAAERGAGDSAAAERWYAACLALQPTHPRALHGAARVALERGREDAVARFDAALKANPQDADLWLGKAQALDVAGEAVAARGIAEALVAQAPGWEPAMRFLAQLRLAVGGDAWDAHYANAAQARPADPNIRADWIAVLAGNDRNAEAAEVAAAARTAFPAEERFALLEAIHAGAAGDTQRAETIFTTLDLDTPDRHTQEARHALRLGDPAHADMATERALALAPGDIAAWAMRGLAWRLLDDPRLNWLLSDGAIAFMPLADDQALETAVPLLHRLHDGSPLPLGQSLRGGTQTRGLLFSRAEPELAALRRAIDATVEQYRTALPPADAAHPLLRHRDTRWRFAGSWSVRLTGGGDHHAAHIHPQGIVSSALYAEVPEGGGGALELGRPPRDLGLHLPPLRTLAPRPGHLALFPSFLHHGTTPFAGGRRMSVAFDVVPEPAR